MDEGLIKKMPIDFIKLIIEGVIEKFLSSRELTGTGYSYEEALNEMIDIVMNGLIVAEKA